MEISNVVDIDSVEDMTPTYSNKTITHLGDHPFEAFVEDLNNNDILSWSDEAEHTVETDLSQSDFAVHDIVTSQPIVSIETVSRLVKYWNDDVSGSVYVVLKGADELTEVDFDEMDGRHEGQLISSEVEIGYMMSANKTLLRTAYVCQNDHVNYRKIPRGSEILKPPKCLHTVERADTEEPCPSKPTHQIRKEDVEEFQYSLSVRNNIITMTTREMVLTHPDKSDSDSDTLAGEVDQPLVDTFESRDTVRIIARVLSIDQEEERSTNYYLHIVGYEEVEDRLTDEDREELEELEENINPIQDLSEKIGKSEGVEDSHGQINRARKVLLLSAVKGSEKTQNHNIHVLLGGKSGSGKTRLARSLTQLTHGEYVDMQKSSEAGIIGSNQQADELGGRYVLEGGAVTQASGGICVIDELDKVQRSHKQTILGEPMQAGEVKVTKTADGTLPADASFVITANPEDDLYNTEDNIDSFQIEPHIRDRIDIATRIDPYANADGYDTDTDQREEDIQSSLVNQLSENDDQDIDREQISKYIKYAKEHEPDPLPVADYISHKIVALETEFSNTSERLQSTIVNLSTAVAKLHFRDEVKEQDVDIAVDLYKETWNTML